MDIEAIIETLPADLQDYIKDGAWLMSCNEIARRNNFTDDATEVLKGEVLFGIADRELREELRISLVESLRIPGILANDIAKEIEEKVFREVRLIEPPLLDEGNEHLLPQETPQNLAASEVQPPLADTTDALPGAPTLATSEVMPGAPNTEVGPEKPLMPPLEKEIPQIAVPPKSAVDAKLRELREAAEKAALEKQYLGNDPYREPIA